MLLRSKVLNNINLIGNKFNFLKTKTMVNVNNFIYNIKLEENFNISKKINNINFFFDKTTKGSNNISLIDPNKNISKNDDLILLNNNVNNKIQNIIIDSTMPLNTGKKRLVILGCGWGGARLARDIDCNNKYDLTIISSKNHMVFTPLLASSCVGTVHSQSVIENIRHLQPNLRSPQNHFYLAHVTNIDTYNNNVECISDNNTKFKIGFDKLVIATGGKPLTFNILGVKENTYFLKTLNDSIKIRKKLLENVCLAGIPNMKTEDRNKLLHFVVVGGGPTGVEFASELCNFINEDMSSYNPRIRASAKITLIEGNEVLNSFDKKLSSYAIQKLIDGGVYIKKAQVNKVNKNNIELSDGSKIDYGICVWSTGIGATDFINSLSFNKSKNGRINVDGFMRVYENNKINNNIYALGDACVNEENPLPPLAQVAEQQGKFLAHYLNNIDYYDNNSYSKDYKFNYNHLGSMVSLTTGKGILEIGSNSKYKFTGLSSWIAWRSAYLTKLQTSKNKINILSQWIGTYIKGREIGF
tara:strand:+ start:2731 stop:4311 length:1581 start_codon:yes stop_codon:yes gene_type:complete